MNQETTTHAAFGTFVNMGIHLGTSTTGYSDSPVFYQSPFSVLGYHIAFGN